MTLTIYYIDRMSLVDTIFEFQLRTEYEISYEYEICLSYRNTVNEIENSSA